MKRIILLAVAAVGVLLGGCNDVGSCPSASAIVPGGSCTGDSLECPYVMESPSPACDGTTAEGGLATSCVCSSGTWSCPSPVTCDSTGDDGGDDGGGGGDAASE